MDTLHRLRHSITRFSPSATMFHNDPSPLSVRGPSQADQIFRQLSALLFHILECPPLESLSGSFGRGRVRKSHMTPVGFASLLFGIASTLMFIGSTAFMIGVMMMPLVAVVAMVFSVIAIVGNLAVPGMWPWCQSERVNKEGRQEDCINDSLS